MAIYDDKQQREIFHFLFLKRLLNISDPNLYALKGGVNLRFFYNSPRYSEDMDLDVFGGSVQTLKKNGYKILNDASFKRSLRAFGVEDFILNDPMKAKHTETTQRFRLQLVNANGDKFGTKVEFSRRNLARSEIVILGSLLPEIARTYRQITYECQHYDPKSAVLQKIRALGGRKEVQARDVFDLYILHQSGYLLRQEVVELSTKNERENAINALMGITYESYVSQVVEFLELDSRKQFGERKTWEAISQLIEEVLA